MTTATIEAEVLELENRFWQAIKDQNIEEIKSLTEDQSLVAGSQGIGVWDRNSLAEMMKSPGWKLNQFEIKDGAHVLQLQDDVVAVGYEVSEELTVDGKPTWQIGFPIHWGFTGSPGHAGPLANLLTPSAMDPNTWTPEYKSFLVRLEKA